MDEHSLPLKQQLSQITWDQNICFDNLMQYIKPLILNGTNILFVLIYLTEL